MKYTVIIDQGYAYAPVASNINLAIRRACDQHDRIAKERQKNGAIGMQTISQIARKRGVRIHVTAETERAQEAPVERAVKRRRSVQRGLLR